MRRIRSKGMRPELAVRKLVHNMGYRYRLHGKNLLGKPDLVFASRRKVIFVNGCFWHWHKDTKCKIARLPKSRLGYWKPKLSRNRERDAENLKELKRMGYACLVVWECQIAKRESLPGRITRFLGKPSVKPFPEQNNPRNRSSR